MSFLVAAVLRQQLGQDIALEWFAGPGLEVVRYDPVRPLSSEYAAGSGATEARPNASAGLSASFGRKLQLTVIAGATVPLTETHYDIVQGSERRIIGEASPVVPTLGVEMGF